MKICFTSCMDAIRAPHQTVWEHVQAQNPHVLMLLGDQIYMDWGLFGTDWRELIGAEPRDGLQAFAQDMHMRYAHQWAVPEFQRLICEFAGRVDPARLLVTWDDHDFAWNNALGVDGDDEAHRHGTPASVKTVSHALHSQFVQQLRTAARHAPYPPLPPHLTTTGTTDTPDLFWQGNLGADNPVPTLLLDTRWHRQARATDASLLGPAQTQALLQAAARPHGLLLVAGGTPMHHRYLVSQQAWHGSDSEPHYREYALLTEQAARPVLYLSGDVHRNALSGVLPRLDGAHSQVVQVLSSGAAIGRYGPKRFAPSYGVADVTPNADGSGHVHIALWAEDNHGHWQTQAPAHALAYTPTGWTRAPQAEAFADVPAQADSAALHILNARESRNPGATLLKRSELQDFNAAFAPDPTDSGQLPQALTLHAVADQELELSFSPASLMGASGLAALEQQVQRTFETALDGGKKSVVLFVHGFGKSFADSAAQAYELRASYPDCEPLLYSWFAGAAGGAVAALTGINDALASAQTGANGLATLLRALGATARNPRYAPLAKVVLARSAGSVALNEALRTAEAGFGGELAGVTRVVLSAPLLKTSAFNLRAGLGWLTDIPLVFTRNRHDQTLRLADWVDGFGPILGLDDGFGVRHPNAWCLDFTESAWVGRLHDYLLPDISGAQRSLNQWLLTDTRAFNPGHPELRPHILRSVGREVFAA
jgi:PhoD-like phosphatase/Alpha/beta hydrolase of unknown function (DUF900)